MQDRTFGRLSLWFILAGGVAISCAPVESDSNNDGGGGPKVTWEFFTQF
ncbi:hypothetical protein SCE1572_51050 [Sorangium cellulosum So0157-2]|uniref:Uncharacterized protein n=1 Tax=Sorangium cellulosum So0157-2 TaxID=1254432 RepID=S4YGV8_SORCE|nr:hypothetical protein SCE1572_51050 [Sorangium cellulosum So0157-2]